MAQDWWIPFYDDGGPYAGTDGRTPEEIQEIVAFLRQALALQPGDRVFDQCCGEGALSLPLARDHFQVLGVDGSASAIQRANAAGTGARYEVGDAFAYVATPACDAGFCWGTAFGNAGEDGRNLEMLRRARESLKPKARFVLDYPNFAGVLAHFQPTMSRTVGDVVVVRESRLDLEQGVLRQQWTTSLPDGTRRQAETAVRMYLPDQLGRMLRQAGFRPLAFHGGPKGEPLTRHTLRCQVVAEREDP